MITLLILAVFVVALVAAFAAGYQSGDHGTTLRAAAAWVRRAAGSLPYERLAALGRRPSLANLVDEIADAVAVHADRGAGEAFLPTAVRVVAHSSDAAVLSRRRDYVEHHVLREAAALLVAEGLQPVTLRLRLTVAGDDRVRRGHPRVDPDFAPPTLDLRDVVDPGATVPAPLTVPLIEEEPTRAFLSIAGRSRVDAAPGTRIGRGRECEVVLADTTVSQVHARLEFESGAWTIEDNGSTNGTWVNGHRLAAFVARILEDGDAIRLAGHDLITFRCHETESAGFSGWTEAQP